MASTCPRLPTGTAKKVFVLDDHPVLRLGLKAILEEEPDFVICGEADSCASALERIHTVRPDVGVFEVNLPDGDGIELMQRLLDGGSGVQVLIYSEYEDLVHVARAFRAGARAYVTKREVPAHLVDALHEITAGRLFLSNENAAKIACAIGQTTFNPVKHSLSSRELEVFEWLGRGFNIRTIAAKLKVSPKTVETYRGRIKGKLRIKCSNDLLRYAMRYVRRLDI